MADQKVADTTRLSAETALELRSEDLIKRPAWGTLSFEVAEKDLDRIYGILSHLVLLPLEHLTDQTLSQIDAQIAAVTETLGKLDSFAIEQTNPTQVRDQLVGEVHQRADAFYAAATPWIPYLAYVRGDVEQNIQSLTGAVIDARKLVADAKDDIEKKSKTIDKIVVAAREASATAGAAVFTQDFEKEAKRLTGQSKSWLAAAAVLAGIGVALAVVIFFTAEQGLDTGQLVQKSAARLAVLAALFAGAFWCGRVYKALMHQASVNRHRALSLQTFQAFSRAAKDDATRDAVLLEATRAVFGAVATGLIGTEPSAGSGLHVVEIARRIAEQE